MLGAGYELGAEVLAAEHEEFILVQIIDIIGNLVHFNNLLAITKRLY